MSDYLRSLLRDLVRKLLGIVFAWIAVHFVVLPNSVKSSVENWAVLAITALFLVIWTTIVRALETRQGSQPLDGWLRALGRILMLGVKGLPVYVLPPEKPKAQEIPVAPVAPLAEQTMVIPTVPPLPTPTVLPSGDPIH